MILPHSLLGTSKTSETLLPARHRDSVDADLKPGSVEPLQARKLHSLARFGVGDFRVFGV